MRRLLIGGSPDQGRYPASEVNDGACPEKPVHLTAGAMALQFALFLPLFAVAFQQRSADCIVLCVIPLQLIVDARLPAARRFGLKPAPLLLTALGFCAAMELLGSTPPIMPVAVRRMSTY